MINANCLVMTPELEELNSQFPKLPSKLFRDYVSRWQYEYGREGKIPTKDELIGLITKVSDNWADYVNPDEAIEIIAKQDTDKKVKIHKLERIYTYINRIYRNQ